MSLACFQMGDISRLNGGTEMNFVWDAKDGKIGAELCCK